MLENNLYIGEPSEPQGWPVWTLYAVTAVLFSVETVLCFWVWRKLLFSGERAD
ncbi:MAG: hypothetical protein Q7R67_02240 [bacterium]|nr:hypothetical protein [bacterium]